MTPLRTGVGKDARFIVGVHTPHFGVKNLRSHDYVASLGQVSDGTTVDNCINFPSQDLYEPHADLIYEIANAFPFRGTTYINSAWADIKAAHPETIGILKPGPCSLIQNFEALKGGTKTRIKDKKALLDILPHPLLIALAQASTDPEELTLLAKKSCCILFDPENPEPAGIGYKPHPNGRPVPDIFDPELFEVLVNNPYLPDAYKNTMVLKPGVQGPSEIVGEYFSEDGHTHVFEYLRRNSYIPWGHFAANMANDAIRYSAQDLCLEDMRGIRHLYYQRTYVNLSADLDIACTTDRRGLTETELETLRKKILEALQVLPDTQLEFDSTLWGWNFGFGYAQSGHRLHASHQMIHQQNAMIPRSVHTGPDSRRPSFSCGDLIHEFTQEFAKKTGQPFFETYLRAIKNNTRTDKNPNGPCSLILFEDDHTLLFVPKAQVCDWELQLMAKTGCGNIVEADTRMRQSLDRAILMAVKTLEFLGAQLVTAIEFSKRFDATDPDQRLLYSFIPRLPYAPATFSEAQLRWICGSYPEDFAHACRRAIQTF